MMQAVIKKLIDAIVQYALENKNEIVDMVLDMIEKKATEDDKAWLIQLCTVLRGMIGVPDDDTDNANPV